MARRRNEDRFGKAKLHAGLELRFRPSDGGVGWGCLGLGAPLLNFRQTLAEIAFPPVVPWFHILHSRTSQFLAHVAKNLILDNDNGARDSANAAPHRQRAEHMRS